MPENNRSIVAGDVVTDEPELTIEDVCAACGMTREEIAAYVAEGLAEAKGPVVEWRFSRLTVLTFRRAARLKRDLGLNPPGVALALELMDRIEELQRRLARYETE
jgi:chaperone modulatory protein CbpM